MKNMHKSMGVVGAAAAGVLALSSPASAGFAPPVEVPEPVAAVCEHGVVKAVSDGYLFHDPDVWFPVGMFNEGDKLECEYVKDNGPVTVIALVPWFPAEGPDGEPVEGPVFAFADMFTDK